MKVVILKSITMHNFRGEHDRTTAFANTETFICGRNGIGKSRHFDATIWLLFGKDSADRKDYEIKTRGADGNELHEIETFVEGVFDVNGETITLKRQITEDWVKPRGTTERVFKGNRTECWYNGTPVSVTEYGKRVDAIIDATLFKMLTNPAYFVGMKWQLQREQLMQMAGAMDDAAIIAEHPEFATLLDAISGKSLEDYRKEMAATRKRLQNDLDQIQPRIDQTNRMMPEAVNVPELKQAEQECDAQIAELDKAIADASAAIRRSYDIAQERTRRIGELRLQQTEIVNAANQKAKEDAAQANAARVERESQLRSLHTELSSENINAKRITDDITRLQQDITNAQERRQRLLDEWQKAYGEQYTGDDMCPHCHQLLPQEMRDGALQAFNNHRATTLAGITERGKAVAAQIKGMTDTLEIMQKNADKVAERIAAINGNINAVNDALAATPVVSAKMVNGADIPEWNALQSQIDEINATIHTDNTQVDTTGIQAEKRAVMAKRDSIRTQMAQDDARTRGFAEIERLKANGKELAQAIADIEHSQFVAESFIRARVAECEKRINAMFTMVQFRMFDYTQDGNAFECCIPMINGVPYGAANNAAKINAGLDIINAMVRHYGIAAPIFIDNAEGINEHIHTDSQIINLVVTTDNTIIIK